MARWLEVAPAERAALEPPLRDFIRRYPSDDLARPARVYLAWILIQQKKLVEARAVVSGVREGPPGSVQDFAVVTEAAIQIRLGQPEAALELLAPLQGKIIDPAERLVFGEQLVQAALGGRRWRRAVGSMLDWLAESPPEDREGVQAAIEHLLPRIPVSALERALGSMQKEATAADQASVRAPARDALCKVLQAFLVRMALERRDAALARRLLDSGPPSLQRGETGAALIGLAASGAVVARVAGRTVGLVLSLGSPELQQRSAEVVEGLSRALGLPATAPRPDTVRLLTRDDGGGLEAALATLAGDGSAILVAGVDEPGARTAAAFAQTAALPVLVLHYLGDVPPQGFSFVVGADLAGTTTLLEAALGAPQRVDCPLARGARLPLGAWARQHVSALLLAGDAACARTAVEEVSAARLAVRLGFALSCADLFTTTGSKFSRTAVAVGSFPVASDGSLAPAFVAWQKLTGAPPTYFQVLGHDAGQLAAAALADFPLESTREPEQVTQLHRRAQTSLAGATADLWSTEKPGFEGGRILARQARIVESP